MPLILPPTDANIRTAATRLRLGDVIAFPTETVYGLGGDTMNPAAIERIYRLKGRPADNPLIAHVAAQSEARVLAARWDDRCEKLALRFWPGPLTLVVPRADAVPGASTAGLPTIAVRCPNHPVARALLEEFAGPISAPSANRSGYVSPTTAQHVADDFADQVDMMVLDGGPCGGGIESTVLEVSDDVPRILRPGGVTAEQIRAVIGDVWQAPVARQAASPGTSMQHYSPR
jgi:L-threonylcarbamoyladenylate synthase